MKLIVTLDSLLDIRYPYTKLNDSLYSKRIRDDEEPFKLMRYRDKRHLIGVKQTNIKRLIMLIKTFNETYKEVHMITDEDTTIVINTYPYLLTDREQQLLLKVFRHRIQANNILYLPPTLGYYEDSDVIIDYYALYNFDLMLQQLKEANPIELTNKLMDTKLVGPKLIWDNGSLNQSLDNGQVKHMFERIMDEYSIMIGLELVDVNFFNNSEINTEVKNE